MQIDPLLFLIMTELLLATAAVSIVLAVVWVSRRKRDRKAAATLVERIKEDQERRKQETQNILLNKFRFASEQADELATLIDHEEKRFYQVLINTYLRRDAAGFENMAVEYENAVNPYRVLEPPVQSEGGAGQAGDIDESAEISRLKEENKRLSEEVRITMETMGRMLNEYSAMFAGGGGDELDREKIRSMFQAEAANMDAKASAVGGEGSAEQESPEPTSEEAAGEQVMFGAEEEGGDKEEEGGNKEEEVVELADKDGGEVDTPDSPENTDVGEDGSEAAGDVTQEQKSESEESKPEQ